MLDKSWKYHRSSMDRSLNSRLMLLEGRICCEEDTASSFPCVQKPFQPPSGRWYFSRSYLRTNRLWFQRLQYVRTKETDLVKDRYYEIVCRHRFDTMGRMTIVSERGRWKFDIKAHFIIKYGYNIKPQVRPGTWILDFAEKKASSMTLEECCIPSWILRIPLHKFAKPLTMSRLCAAADDERLIHK